MYWIIYEVMGNKNYQVRGYGKCIAAMDMQKEEI
jgi:hypothetical protein